LLDSQPKREKARIEDGQARGIPSGQCEHNVSFSRDHGTKTSFAITASSSHTAEAALHRVGSSQRLEEEEEDLPVVLLLESSSFGLEMNSTACNHHE
jgi:hypothetical protein